MQRITHAKIDRLCGHHVVEDFDCGQDHLNRELAHFKERFEDGHRVLGFVSVESEDSLVVTGYIALLDTRVHHPPSGRSVKCFVVSAMAVASSHRKEGLFHDLTERALQAMAARQQDAKEAGTPYRALICMPEGNSALERWLRWAHFRPFGSEGLFWLPLLEDEDLED